MKKNLTKLLALALAAIMLLSFAACGKDKGPDVTGKYNCIAIAEDGVNFTAPLSTQSYVELKKGGKGEISDELSFELTWTLDGENFSGNYKIFGIDAPITGTLKDGVLEIHDDNVVTRYLKEGAELPAWASDVAAAEPSEEGRLAGRYTLYAMEVAGVRYDYATLVEMEMMDSSYLQIDYDAAAGYTGILSFDGEDPDTFTLEDELGILNFPSGEQMGFFEDAPGVIGNISTGFDPYLFLLTENGTLEYVDLFRCARYGTYVCGGPVYGVSDVTELYSGIAEMPDHSYASVYALDASGAGHDLLESVYLSDGLPRAMAGGFCRDDGGAWYGLSLDDSGSVQAQYSAGDGYTNYYTGFPPRLGMNRDGLVYALDLWDDAGHQHLSVCALMPGSGMLVLTQITGDSVFDLVPGDVLYLFETYKGE